MPISPPPNAKRVFNGSIMDFWQWEQKMFDGSVSTFECVTRQDSLVVIPFLDRDTVLLTKQIQPQRGSFLDFPGGRVDKGETHLEAAQRELAEETGYRATHWHEWDRMEHRGWARFEQSIYLTTGAHLDSKPHLDAGENIESLPTPWSDVVELCLKGQLRQQYVMLAVLGMHFDPEKRQRLDQFLSSPQS